MRDGGFRSGGNLEGWIYVVQDSLKRRGWEGKEGVDQMQIADYLSSENSRGWGCGVLYGAIGLGTRCYEMQVERGV